MKIPVLYSLSLNRSGADLFRSLLGEMSERLKEPVLKTGDAFRVRGFESHSLRHFI